MKWEIVKVVLLFRPLSFVLYNLGEKWGQRGVCHPGCHPSQSNLAFRQKNKQYRTNNSCEIFKTTETSEILVSREFSRIFFHFHFSFSISSRFNFTFTSRKRVKGFYFSLFTSRKKWKLSEFHSFFLEKKEWNQVRGMTSLHLVFFLKMWNFSKFKFHLCGSSFHSSLYLQIKMTDSFGKLQQRNIKLMNPKLFYTDLYVEHIMFIVGDINKEMNFYSSSDSPSMSSMSSYSASSRSSSRSSALHV